MLTIDPKNTPVPRLHGYMLGAIAPRPIAFASTIDKDGNPNLSPFSFFNAFSANPPICVFSPARRAKDNTTKHTYENAKEVKEVVINMVNYNLVQQMSLSSSDFPEGVNEFEKTGLTPIDSEMVRPFRVAESPVQMECKITDIIELGNQGGAGNLIVCEIVLIHINEEVLDENEMIDPYKIDLVSRMGGNWYCRANGDSLFEVEKPIRGVGIGVDNIPKVIRNSSVLTGNDLGQLGNVKELPAKEDVDELINQGFLTQFDGDKTIEIHHFAKKLIQKGEIRKAWESLLTIS